MKFCRLLDENLLATFRIITGSWLSLKVTAIWLHFPGTALVSKLGIEKISQFPLEFETLHRHQNFYATLKITLHGIR